MLKSSDTDFFIVGFVLSDFANSSWLGRELLLGGLPSQGLE